MCVYTQGYAKFFIFQSNSLRYMMQNLGVYWCNVTELILPNICQIYRSMAISLNHFSTTHNYIPSNFEWPHPTFESSCQDASPKTELECSIFYIMWCHVLVTSCPCVSFECPTMLISENTAGCPTCSSGKDSLLLELFHLVCESKVFFTDAIFLRHPDIFEEYFSCIWWSHAHLVNFFCQMDACNKGSFEEPDPQHSFSDVQ